MGGGKERMLIAENGKFLERSMFVSALLLLLKPPSLVHSKLQVGIWGLYEFVLFES